MFLCEHRSCGSLPVRGLTLAAHSTHLLAKRPHPGSLRDHHIRARIHAQNDEACDSRGLVLELEPIVCFLEPCCPGVRQAGKCLRKCVVSKYGKRATQAGQASVYSDSWRYCGWLRYETWQRWISKETQFRVEVVSSLAEEARAAPDGIQVGWQCWRSIFFWTAFVTRRDRSGLRLHKVYPVAISSAA